VAVSTSVQVFEQLLRRRVTFNAYTYHCLLQLCGSAGSLDDALAVYNLQVGRASGRYSDSYTISYTHSHWLAWQS